MLICMKGISALLKSITKLYFGKTEMSREVFYV